MDYAISDCLKGEHLKPKTLFYWPMVTQESPEFEKELYMVFPVVHARILKALPINMQEYNSKRGGSIFVCDVLV